MRTRLTMGLERLAKRSLMAGATALTVFAGSANAAPAEAAPAVSDAQSTVMTRPDVVLSAPVASERLRDIVPRPDNNREVERQIRRLPLPLDVVRVPLKPAADSSAAQNGPTGVFGPLVATTNGLNFAGLGQGDYGFNVNSAPPDTTGAVGATQFVQWVNTSLVVFDKATGARTLGPISGNQIFANLGSNRCATQNDGDPIVAYDKAASRWVLTQFVASSPYLQCVAVSQTSDATGAYNLYSFTLPNFGDYPKISVWPDAYYISFNVFGTTTFQGARACAYDRARMLTGATATQVCFQLSSSFGGLLPSDLDGATPPPAGSPNYFVNFGSARLNVWRFHADFATPANSTFTGPTAVTVPAFTTACGTSGTCIPQPGTTNRLDSLSDRLMYRLAYRNLAGTESLLVNHSVRVGSKTSSPTGVRWYELRIASQAPSLFQSGTFSPDTTHRWMGSIGMDKVGNIAVGYSASSSSVFPSVRYSGRAPGDPLGTLQSEQTIIAGSGSQTGSLHRWGDYSTLTVDPVDDCTFWYTQEYGFSAGSFNWKTRVASFRFPTCN